MAARPTPCPRGTSAARADGGGAVVGDARPTAPLADDGGTVMPVRPDGGHDPRGRRRAALAYEEDDHGRGHISP
jgi:hypothetical protein